jgi:hypothetical protein
MVGGLFVCLWLLGEIEGSLPVGVVQKNGDAVVGVVGSVAVETTYVL